MNVIDKFASFYNNLASMQVNELSMIYCPNVSFIDPIAKHKGLASVETYFAKLLNNAAHCEFEIHSINSATDTDYFVNWTMRYTSTRINSGNPIAVEGVTFLKIEDNLIVFHRDYYDLGQMVYEHVPILGRIIKFLKKGLS